MTCAACSNRIQRKLDRLDGVDSSLVNFATGRATVVHDATVGDQALRETIEGLGYAVVDHGADEAAEAREAELRRRLVVAATLSIPAMILSMVPAIQFAGWDWVVAALATPAIFWSGWTFHRAALLNLRHHSTTMDTLVSMGSVASWLWSIVVLVGRDLLDLASLSHGHVYFETGAVIVTLILVGKWLEHRAKRRSGDAIRALADLGVGTAVLQDGTEIAVEALEVGMRFLVRPGQKVATDGVVVSGHSAIDMSMVTGEPVPVEVEPGSEVIGATINANGSLVVEATRVGEATALAQIIELVDRAQGSRAEVQRLADRVAAIFVPTAILVAALTLIGWFVTGHEAHRAFTAAVAVLIIACPCALGLATPLAIMVGTGRGAQLGVIIKGGEVLEDSRAVDVIILDKTGTITEGRMELDRIGAPELDPATRARVIALAAAAEANSEHPIALAICAGVGETGQTGEAPVGLRIDKFTNRPGRGVVATIDGERIAVGRRSLFDHVSPAVEAVVTEAEAAGATAVLAGRWLGSPSSPSSSTSPTSPTSPNSPSSPTSSTSPASSTSATSPNSASADPELAATAEVVFVVTDRIKATSAEAITALHELGLATTLLTGDNRGAAEHVAAEVGIDRVIAEVLPQDKVTEVERLQRSGARVAMVGDGINDAPALAQADLGIAIGTGADVAIEASDLTVVSGDLLAVADAVALARRTLSTIRSNLFWAFAYNAAAIPLAAFGVLNPMIAAAAMGLSSLFVVTNSLRLRRFSGIRAA